MADEVGRILIISFSPNLPSLDAIKQIHGSDHELQNCVQVNEYLDAYPWMIKNKYFTTDVQLCHSNSSSTQSAVKTSLIRNSDLNFEGVILIFDQQQRDSLKEATDWMEYVQSQNASVRLLLNAGHDTVNDNEGTSKTVVLKWCLKYSFELVELKPNGEDQEEAGEFGEQTGFPRVVQALNCGEWPNIQLKSANKGMIKANTPSASSSPSSTSSTSSTDDAKCNKQKNKNYYLPNGNKIQECKTDEEKATIRLTDCSGVGVPVLTDGEAELLHRLGQEDPDGESFEELFMKLRDMKDRASTLPDSQRKSYAEQVAVAFWNAMGGEDDEISGLNDSD